jgi:hypothetical protein
MPANLYRFDLQTRGWWPLNYAQLPSCLYMQEGEGLTSLLMGCANGQLYEMGQGTSDDGEEIACDVITPSFDFQDSRAQKLFLDLMVDIAPDGVTITVVPLMDNRETALAGTDITGTLRAQTPVPMADTDLTLYRNIALQITWSSDTGTPVLYEFQPNALLQPFLAKNFSTQFLSHGWTGFGHARDAYMVYISTADITFEIVPNDEGPQIASTITLPSSGGNLAKSYFVLPVIKGLMFRYNATCDTDFVMFGDETIVRVKEWGGDNYHSFRPFIGQVPSNLVGA